MTDQVQASRSEAGLYSAIERGFRASGALRQGIRKAGRTKLRRPARPMIRISPGYGFRRRAAPSHPALCEWNGPWAGTPGGGRSAPPKACGWPFGESSRREGNALVHPVKHARCGCRTQDPIASSRAARRCGPPDGTLSWRGRWRLACRSLSRFRLREWLDCTQGLTERLSPAPGSLQGWRDNLPRRPAPIGAACQAAAPARSPRASPADRFRGTDRVSKGGRPRRRGGVLRAARGSRGWTSPGPWPRRRRAGPGSRRSRG